MSSLYRNDLHMNDELVDFSDGTPISCIDEEQVWKMMEFLNSGLLLTLRK